MDSYTKLRIIGTGSFGTVWLIRSKLNQRNYVLKEISMAAVQDKERVFILNEVKVLSSLRHKNIVRYKEAFYSNDFLCISMEYAHEDIKSKNIFLAKNSVIKLGDFGIARVLQNTFDHAQTIIGTPYYLSPEICQQQPYNHKSDIWALGCVLYEMVTLKHPFESQDFTRLVFKILNSDYEQIPENHGQLLSDLVGVLLRVEPNERPSAKQILHIPAMKEHVDKVLGRGRMQRSESVSCCPPASLPANGHVRPARNVWRRPSEDRGEEQVTVPKQDEGVPSCERKDPSSRRAVIGRGQSQDDVERRDVVAQAFKVRKVEKPRENGGSRTPSCAEKRVDAKRPSSEAFVSENERGCFAQAEYGMLLKEAGKPSSQNYPKQKRDSRKVLAVDQRALVTKHRAYSTSQVRECAAAVRPKPLMPVKDHPAPYLNKETYDVPTEQRLLHENTYTIKDCHSEIVFDEEPNCIGKTNTKNTPTQATLHPPSPTQAKEKRTLDLIKVMLTANHPFSLGNITPQDSIRMYMRSVRSNLQRSLGSEKFETAYRYLAGHVLLDLESGVDVTMILHEVLGEENLACLPLMMQLLQFDKLISVEKY